MTTNDPEHPNEVLTCKGKILEPLKMDPKRLTFGKISRKAPTSKKKMVITRGDGGPLKPKLQPVKTKGVDAQLREIEAGERYQLEVTINPPSNTARVRASLKLETGIAESPIATIPIYATITPRVAANPSRIRVPRKRASNWEKAIKLVWDDDAPHKIVSASVNDPGLGVRVDENNGRQQVILQVPVDYAPQPGAHVVTVNTDDAESPVVRVSVSMAAQRRTPRPKGRASQSRNGPKPKHKRITPGKTKPETPPPDRTKAETKNPEPTESESTKAQTAKPSASTPD